MWLDGCKIGLTGRRSSTPAVVPGAAPALAKAGVGGYQSCTLGAGTEGKVGDGPGGLRGFNEFFLETPPQRSGRDYWN